MLEIIVSLFTLLLIIVASIVIITAFFSGIVLGLAYMIGKFTAKAVITTRETYFVSKAAYEREMKTAQRAARKPRKATKRTKK